MPRVRVCSRVSLGVVWLVAGLGCGRTTIDLGEEYGETEIEIEPEDHDQFEPQGPLECQLRHLTLYEGFAGKYVSDVMLTEAEGGVARVSGSCGGAGVEKAYLFTAQVSTRYLFHFSASDFDGFLHVREGESCHGLELRCVASGTPVELYVEQGETLVLVADTPAELVPEPEGGSLHYQVGVTWAD